jgi:hypothetical protein
MAKFVIEGVRVFRLKCRLEGDLEIGEECGGSLRGDECNRKTLEDWKL